MNWSRGSSVNKRVLPLLLLLGACAVQADTVCRIVASPELAFGQYDTLSNAPMDTLTNIRVSCERNGGPQTVTLIMRLGAGANGSSVYDRRMRQLGGGTDHLSYGLYRDVGRSAVWGTNDNVDSVSQTISIAVPNKGIQSATFTIYGRIPALQDVSAGTYGDSVDITLTP
jgi:spore coat protein U-like protein